MIWAIPLVICGLLLALLSPFLSFLTPSESIVLVDVADPNNPIILGSGANTLWAQWQCWAYIAAFCLVLVTISGVLFNAIRAFSDEVIIENKQRLSQRAAELETLKQEYRQKIQQDVLNEHAEKEEKFKQWEKGLLSIQHQTEEQERKVQHWIAQTQHALKQQQRETHSKLGQRDRLSEQKRCIAQFLEESNWTFPNGEKFTYRALLERARQHKKE
ncbi:TPA: hypothetical protein ACVU5C_004988 [Vibrio parahaemolyticus]|jgi:hypothetical protein|nr:hypothetical protein [Vibrio parahaemolyticus]HCH1049328.1 hypothetical protein [Vibrio parahaemolyticus]